MYFYQTLSLLALVIISMLVCLYSGFYLGWMSKKEAPPTRMPIVSAIVDTFTAPNKKEKYEEEKVEKSFFS